MKKTGKRNPRRRIDILSFIILFLAAMIFLNLCLNPADPAAEGIRVTKINSFRLNHILNILNAPFKWMTGELFALFGTALWPLPIVISVSVILFWIRNTVKTRIAFIFLLWGYIELLLIWSVPGFLGSISPAGRLGGFLETGFQSIGGIFSFLPLLILSLLIYLRILTGKSRWKKMTAPLFRKKSGRQKNNTRKERRGAASEKPKRKVKTAGKKKDPVPGPSAPGGNPSPGGTPAPDVQSPADPPEEAAGPRETPLEEEFTLDLSLPEIEPTPEQDDRESPEEAPDPEEEPAGTTDVKNGDEARIEEFAPFRELVEKLTLPLNYAEGREGPRYAVYEYDLVPGTTFKNLERQKSEIEFQLNAWNIELLFPVPGKNRVGLIRERENFPSLNLEDYLPAVSESDHELPVFCGLNLRGEEIWMDLTEEPHLLIAGSSGSGKSVFLNALISGYTYSEKGRGIRFILIDPKRVELSSFAEIPQLACPILHEASEAEKALKALHRAMEDRYSEMQERKVRSIKEVEEWPYVMVIIDEWADLLLTSKNEIEETVIALAQKGRAAGIHLVLTTQRPSREVFSGLIKSNCPGRIAFRTAGQIDSRIILDAGGAEKLRGRGDALVKRAGALKLERAQAPRVKD